MRLELSLRLQQNFQEMLYILDSMDELKMRLQSEDFGKQRCDLLGAKRSTLRYFNISFWVQENT